jgi:hypothetical protein
MQRIISAFASDAETGPSFAAADYRRRPASGDLVQHFERD